MKDQFVNTKNNYQYVDYNKQINPVKNDMRTTYDFGHRYQYLNDRIGPPDVSIPDRCNTLATQELHYDYTTETRKQFYFKANSTFVPRADRGIRCNKTQYVQTAEEKLFAHPPQAIDWAKSSYQRDYVQPVQQYVEPVLVDTCAKYRSPAKSQNVIYANSPGHYKYMDLYCTTSMLSYPQHTVEQQNGIGRKDYITLWDWMEFPKGRGFGLKFYPLKQKGARWPPGHGSGGRKQHNNQVVPLAKKSVPNSGIKSESRRDYDVPVPITYETDMSAFSPVAMPFTDKLHARSEYSMYHSGKRIDSLIDQMGPNITTHR